MDEHHVTLHGSILQPSAPLTDSPKRDPAWLSEATRQVEAIGRLSAGWDSQGADAPDAEIVLAAAVFLRTLSRERPDLLKPHINPTRSGGVQFHWQAGPRYFEIELLDPISAQFYYVNRENHEEEEGTVNVRQSLAPVLTLYAKLL